MVKIDSYDKITRKQTLVKERIKAERLYFNPMFGQVAKLKMFQSVGGVSKTVKRHS